MKRPYRSEFMLTGSGTVVPEENCQFEIWFEEEHVATVSSMSDVWNWYFAKRDQVRQEKFREGQSWSWFCLGEHGLVMVNNEKPSEQLEWKTRFVARGQGRRNGLSSLLRRWQPDLSKSGSSS
jgi:hypothetical protein